MRGLVSAKENIGAFCIRGYSATQQPLNHNSLKLLLLEESVMNRHHLSTQEAMYLASIYVMAPVLLVWIGHAIYSNHHAPAVLVSTYQFDEFSGSAGRANTFTEAKPVYNMPPLTLSINAGAQSGGIIKIKLGLEVNQEDLSRLPHYAPRIAERITFFFRQKSYDDMRDPDSMKDLMKNLTVEINKGSDPIKISNVFIRQFVLE